MREAHAAGIDEILFVTGREKGGIEDLFDEDPNLTAFLRAKKDERALARIQGLARRESYFFLRQAEARGLGDAVLHGRRFVGKRPFAVFLPDDWIDSDTPAIGRLLEVHRKTGGAVLGLERVPKDRISSYGVVDAEPVRGTEGVFRVRRVVEKPSIEKAPSDLTIVGRYILLPDIFPLLARQNPGRLAEIQLSDALDALARKGKVWGAILPGIRFDTGTPAGLLEATVHRGLASPEGERIRRLVSKRLLRPNR